MTRTITFLSILLLTLLPPGLLLAGLLAAPAAALPQSFIVDSELDQPDVNPGDGLCATVGGACTLRAAVQEANAFAGNDAIFLPPGTYTLAIPGALEDAAASGDLDILESVTIRGVDRATTIINANHLDRAIETQPDVKLVTIRHLTILNGLASDFGGAAANRGKQLEFIDVVLRDNSAPDGGALYNEQFIKVQESEVRDNLAGRGGAIYNAGVGVIDRSMVTGNMANSPTGSGGAIFNGLNARFTLRESTVSYNSSVSDKGGGVSSGGILLGVNSTLSHNSAATVGGALYLSAFGSSVLTHTTILSNSAPTGSGISISAGGAAELIHSVVAGVDPAVNCFGPITSGGFNIENGTSCGLGGPGDMSNTDPQMWPLADNGGDTLTHAPRPSSPAIDAAGATNCAVNDQRGVNRPLDGDGDGTAFCDIGAIEFPVDIIQVEDAFVREEQTGTLTVTFNVRMFLTSPLTVTADIATMDNTAVAPEDYIATSGQIVIPPGAITSALRVVIINDMVPEFDETFFVILSNPVNVMLGDGLAVGTIATDDLLPSLYIPAFFHSPFPDPPAAVGVTPDRAGRPGR